MVSKPREVLTVEQQEKFIDFVYSSPIYNRLGNLFTVLSGTGLRIGEALALTLDDIGFDTGIISIYKTMTYKPGEDGRYGYRISPPKTGAGTREVPTLDEVKAALLREKSNQKPKKKFAVEGYSGSVFLNGGLCEGYQGEKAGCHHGDGREVQNLVTLHREGFQLFLV